MADDADSPCAPLVDCENLSGAVLVRRTIYGPSLIDDPRPLAFGEFSLSGGAIRPYIDLTYETRWIPKGLCRGPVSSVMSLAPTESITAGVRTEHRDSFTQMMTDSAESSSVQTHTRHQLTETTGQVPAGSGGSSGGGLGGVLGGIANAIGSVAGGVKNTIGGVAGAAFGVEKDLAGAVLDLSPIFAGRMGSFLEDLGSVAGDVVGAVVGAPVALAGAAAGAVSGLINGAIGAVGGGGGHGPALTDTQQRIDEITDSMEHRESQSHVRQVVVSSSNESEEFVTRTFSNPYRDRSLQLRFMPIYRHFEVVTTIRSGIPGLAMVAGKIGNTLQNARQSFLSQSVGSVFNQPTPPASGTATAAPSRLVSTATLTRIALGSAQVNHDDQDVRQPMADLLVRNSISTEREKGVHVEQGLRWSAAQTRDNILHVPVADAETATKAWHLNEQTARQFSDAVSILGQDKISKFAPKIQTRQIHLFAGTHVEAVPGDCKLPDIVTDVLSQPANP